MKMIAVLFASGLLFAQEFAPSAHDLEAMLATHPQATEELKIRLQLVRVYELHSEWVLAAAQLEQVRKLAPNDAEYAYQLGSIYQRISKLAFQRMRTLAPKSARVQQVLGEQYAVTGDNAKAIQAYQAAIAAEPKLEGSHAALAMIYLQIGKVAEAQTEIAKELAIAPGSAMAKHVAQAVEQASQNGAK